MLTQTPPLCTRRQCLAKGLYEERAGAGRLHPSLLAPLMAYAYERPHLRDVPEPETPLAIELNIPKTPGVMRTDSTGEPRPR